MIITDTADGGLEFVEGEDAADGSFMLTNHCNINALITQVQKIVKFFRRSPLKNSVLQNYVKGKHQKEINLILDCKTRWNSLVQMLDRFVSLKDCLQKTMIDLAVPICLSDYDFEVLGGIVKCLEPRRLTVLALCRSDANLYTADASFRFMFEELSKISTTFSKELQVALRQRINERRTVASSTLFYLCNPVKYKNNSARIELGFDSPDTKEIAKFIETLVKRLSPPPVQEDDYDSEDEVSLDQLRTDKNQKVVSLKEKLNTLLENAMATSTSSSAKVIPLPLTHKSLVNIIKKEMTLFETGGCRGRNLQLAYEYLMTIPPTSVESERALSVAGSFSTKIRSRLGDDSLNALMALRSHFISK